MKKRSLLVFLVCLISFGLIFSGIICKAAEEQKKCEGKAAAASTQAPPATIELYSPLWKTHKKSAVMFFHEKHAKEYKVSCTECHHVYKDGKNVWKEGMEVKKCEACHNEPTVKGEKKLSPELQKKNLKLAFHNNCIGCHKKLKKENPKTKAPTTCSKCHPKKKK
ncbi:MAG: hypothetical protein DRG83_20930 [Deltaproteobacteria bacterium]|nr:MAG: hypothetical protein DRG83_20930 [Deltaproteobacteria bacterium]